MSRQLLLGEDTGPVGRSYSSSLIAPDGRTAARTRAGVLSFVDTVTGRTVGEAAPTRDQDFLWSPDSRWLLSVGPDAAETTAVVTVWAASDGSVVARRRFEGDPVVVAFGQRGRVVHVHGVHLLHTLTTESLHPVNAPVTTEGERPFALVAHPRDGSVFVVDGDGSFARMDPMSGDVIASASDEFLSDADQMGVMSPDGSRMVVTGPGLKVRLIDVDEQQYVGTDSNTPWGDSPAYAPDGSQFALVQGERIRLWNGRTGEYQASLPLPNRTGAYSIIYRPGSTGVVIASTDGRTWTAGTRTSKWVDRACAIAGRNLTDDEWRQFFPDRPYEPTCPQWPPAG
jgi:WD40 repeat protein